jgi:hypothetical protein
MLRVWMTIGGLTAMSLFCGGWLINGKEPLAAAVEAKTRVRGEIVDAATGHRLPARVYVQGEDGGWHFPQPEAAGSAVAYRKLNQQFPMSVEMHTTLSAHPLSIDLSPGKYTITVERGKEFFPLVREITVAKEPVRVDLRLRRWIDMAQRGWYSGDTHVHRSVEELPNVMLAEDVNVTFPLTYWVTAAYTSPRSAPRSSPQSADAKTISVDANHVIYPRNTEYEIFTVDRKSHTLGAFFVLNHRSVFERGVPPVRPIAEQARREGGLIEFDKHNWPWSMMIVPIMKVDLYELANNHVWRTEFRYNDWPQLPPEYMKIEGDKKTYTEAGWIDYGFQNYYALLNCGFRIRPTGGTASGVHPVPLGFGRVYVECPDGFGYEKWLTGLNQGRSFVTTGPMLLVSVDNQPPGHTFKQSEAAERSYRVHGSIASAGPLTKIEIIVNGERIRTVTPANRMTDAGGHESPFDESIPIHGTSWIAVRCFEKWTADRFRYAHSSPVHIDVAGKPLRPRKAEIEYLIQRVEEQIARCRGVLPGEAIAEYEEALKVYREIARR